MAAASRSVPFSIWPSASITSISTSWESRRCPSESVMLTPSSANFCCVASLPLWASPMALVSLVMAPVMVSTSVSIRGAA